MCPLSWAKISICLHTEVNRGQDKENESGVVKIWLSTKWDWLWSSVVLKSFPVFTWRMEERFRSPFRRKIACEEELTPGKSYVENTTRASSSWPGAAVLNRSFLVAKTFVHPLSRHLSGHHVYYRTPPQKPLLNPYSSRFTHNRPLHAASASQSQGCFYYFLVLVHPSVELRQLCVCRSFILNAWVLQGGKKTLFNILKPRVEDTLQYYNTANLLFLSPRREEWKQALGA